MLFVADNLDTDGYFCSNILSYRKVILAILPINTVTNSFVQNNNGNISFRIKNARNKKKVRFRFLKSNFSPPAVDEINDEEETKWILTLRMTPIVNDY